MTACGDKNDFECTGFVPLRNCVTVKSCIGDKTKPAKDPAAMQRQTPKNASSICGACGKGAYDVDGIRYCAGCRLPTSRCMCYSAG
jgi:hypothetical protein